MGYCPRRVTTEPIFGCGNGMLRRLILHRRGPRLMLSTRPDGQHAYARTRLAAQGVISEHDDAMALRIEEAAVRCSRLQARLCASRSRRPANPAGDPIVRRKATWLQSWTAAVHSLRCYCQPRRQRVITCGVFLLARGGMPSGRFSRETGQRSDFSGFESTRASAHSSVLPACVREPGHLILCAHYWG
jgi:hypothetical protein